MLRKVAIMGYVLRLEENNPGKKLFCYH